jgi:hypothetical protein
MNKSLRVAGLLSFTSIRRGNVGVILLTILILTLVSLNLLFIPGLLQGLVSGANTQLRNTYSSDIVVQSSTENPLLSMELSRQRREMVWAQNSSMEMNTPMQWCTGYNQKRTILFSRSINPLLKALICHRVILMK